MNAHPVAKFWNLIHSSVLEFWGITEPSIEDAAVKNDIPIELYFYSELGLDYFSIEEFQNRDPFSNPEQFEKMFARFEVQGWIFPTPDERYQVSRKAQEAVRMIIQTGDAQLAGFNLMTDRELMQIVKFLGQIVTSMFGAPEPPEKWAILKRFRVANGESPLVVQIREACMDLFAFRDDSHLSAAYPHFGQAGIVWNVLGSISRRRAVNAAKMAESMAFRGYEASDYEVAIQAAMEIGWVESADVLDTFRPTQKGAELRDRVEQLTDEYFYRPWAVLTKEETDTLYGLLLKLQDNLASYRKSLVSDSHL
jgi:hypothetical protein